MKIFKLLNVLALSLALVLVAGCPGGQLIFDGSGNLVEVEGNPVDIGGGNDDLLLTQEELPPCLGNIILPEGKDAYSQLLPEFIDTQAPFFSRLLFDPIYDEEFGNLLAYDYQYGGQEGNIWATLNYIFDTKAREIFGLGMRDFECVAIALDSRSANFCSGRDVSCFTDYDTAMRNLQMIPYVGPYLSMMMSLLPDSLENILRMFPAIDPAVLMSEIISDAEQQIVVTGWKEGTLVNYKNFIEWFTNYMNDGGDSSISAPDFALLAAAVQNVLVFTPIEGSHEGCFEVSYGPGEEEPPDFARVAGPELGEINLILCERNQFLLGATPASIDELLAREELFQAGIYDGGLTDDPCYKQTYAALQSSDMGPSDFTGCANVHQLQDTLLGKLNSRDPADGGGFGNPLMMLMPYMNREIEMLRVGVLGMLDQKSRVKMSMQFFDENSAAAANAALGHRKQITSSGEIVGYADMVLSFGLDTTSAFNQGIDMDAYVGEEVIGIDARRLMIEILMMFEGILDTYQSEQAQ